MKKIFVYLLAVILLYSFFRELNIVKIMFICLSIGAAYLVYRIPARHIVAMKYPFIFFTLAVTALFLIFPEMVVQYPVDALVVSISFYGLTFYLITIEDKGKGLFKQAAALSIIFLASAFNLSMAGKPLLIVPISIAAMLFLFILDKNRLIPFLGGYTLLIMVLLFSKKMSIFGGGINMSDVHKYLLLAVSFIFLIMGFVGFAKKNNPIKLLIFFGFIYIATDVFMVLNFRLSMGLLYQPMTALFVLTPLVGMMLKAGEERM